TDRAYANLTTATPLVPEEALAAFRDEDPNGVWELTISDDTTGNGGSLNSWSLNITTSTCPFTCPQLPPEVNGSLVVTKTGTTGNVSWSDLSGPFNVYRGTRVAAGAWSYNHTCFRSNLAGPPESDPAVPAAGVNYYYL